MSKSTVSSGWSGVEPIEYQQYKTQRFLIMRELYLDGVRGLAALVVVNEHILRLFYPALFIDTSLIYDNFTLMERLTFPPFNLLHNGGWAVSLFFVLSGYVLSIGFFDNKADIKPIAAMVTRYLRLTVPVVVVLLMCYTIMSADLLFLDSARLLTGTHVAPVGGADVTLWSVIYQSLIGVYLHNDFSHNPVLWTMQAELIGSVVVYLLLFALHTLSWRLTDSASRRYVLYAVLIALTSQTVYLAFVLGVLIADVKTMQYQLLNKKALLIPIIFSGFILLGYNVRGLFDNPYRWITLSTFDSRSEYLYNIWGAALVLLALTHSSVLQRLLHGPLLTWLGQKSYAIYLLNYPILMSVGAGIFVSLDVDDYGVAAAVASAGTLVTTLIIAALFDRLVDRPTVLTLNRLRALAFFQSLPLRQIIRADFAPGGRK